MKTPAFSLSNSRTRPIGIGGTDIGAILGLSPYKTPLELWSELVSGDSPAHRDLLHLRYGQHTESFVAREYERVSQSDVYRETRAHAFPQNSWVHVWSRRPLCIGHARYASRCGRGCHRPKPS